MMAIPGMDKNTNLTGKQSGTFTIDEKTGMLRHSKFKTNINGVVIVMGREVPISIKMIKEIAIKEM